MKRLNWKTGFLLIFLIPLGFLNLSLLLPENGFFFWKNSVESNAKLYSFKYNTGQKTTYNLEWEEKGFFHYVGHWSQEVLEKSPKGHFISHKIQLKAANSSPKDPFTKTFDFKTVNTPKGDILQVSMQNLSEKNRSWVKRFLQVSGLIFPKTPKKKGESWKLRSFTSPFLAKKEIGGLKIEKLKMGLFSIIKKEAKNIKESEIVFDSNSSRIYSFHLKNDQVTLRMKLKNLSQI